MACINMFNSEHQGLCGAPPPMSPRISFSNDFVIGSSAAATGGAAAAPPDPNFEFSSVGSRPMMAADELFFKGRMLPLRGATTTTLRDELRASDGGDHDTWDGARNPRGSAIRWREFLGLRKPHCSSKKAEKVDGSDVLDTINESKSTSEMEV